MRDVPYRPSLLSLTPSPYLNIDNAIVGEALIALSHEDLKEMGIRSAGHRLTILKTIYELKILQGIPLEPDHFIPPCMSIFLITSYQARVDALSLGNMLTPCFFGRSKLQQPVSLGRNQFRRSSRGYYNPFISATTEPP